MNAVNGYATDLLFLSGLGDRLPRDAMRDITSQCLMNGPTSIDQGFKIQIIQLSRELAN